MGLFGKLKSAANFVTGGGAKVAVEVEEATFGETIKVHITAEISSDMNARKIYAKLKSEEFVEVEDFDMAPFGGTTTEIVRHTTQLWDEEFEVDGEQELKEGQTYNWTLEINLPEEEANPTYHGACAHHTWYIFVGIDKSGNDPDSGWVEFDLY